ncbi:hypothetical protein V6N11_049897 [Hibiscus sabdariffa]|uniref:Transmembrane protein n=1 Tax=Hibiscus sabdariffa TaxID=183260 RepID=A0ABR2T939_9ROSI
MVVVDAETVDMGMADLVTQGEAETLMETGGLRLLGLAFCVGFWAVSALSLFATGFGVFEFLIFFDPCSVT